MVVRRGGCNRRIITSKEAIMAGKKDHSFNYWAMNYRGKFRRTKKLMPFTIGLCVLLLILGVLADDLVRSLIWIVIIAAIMVAQYYYTKKKAEEEEAQEAAQKQAAARAQAQAAQAQAQFQAPTAQGAPTQPQAPQSPRQ
ncbi:hypothetical protein CSQ86_00880 [Bifidobacterium felsineum]|uniref:Uncharacterized protein n=2 Tax=Bifidobacterium felsineum TaxID=2045440 RepID=A0A2M9HLH7_9BIFI|nr:hypothetical protein CSQ86_00880 [Bifidobacterium felsineum]